MDKQLLEILDECEKTRKEAFRHCAFVIGVPGMIWEFEEDEQIQMGKLSKLLRENCQLDLGDDTTTQRIVNAINQHPEELKRILKLRSFE